MQDKWTLGSLFDGIGVFPLAGSYHNVSPIFASEIEADAIDITRRHFPSMKHVGDITQLHGADLPPCDLITFGSPCQDLSTAGMRAGLNGQKSSLFYDAVRIINEMRNATNGLFPTVVIWENVYGALVSNHGADFRAVLTSLTGAEIPSPPFGRWAGAGMVHGIGFELAWRLMDAQYWGVPQRRLRIFVVVDYRTGRAGEILFKSRKVQPLSTMCSGSRMSSFPHTGKDSAKSRRELPLIFPFNDRGLRDAGMNKNTKKLLSSFGKPNGPFPTLLTSPNPLAAIFPDGHECIRYPTPLECERLMGLPDEWTKSGESGRRIPDSKRYQYLGNSIAVPCAEYILKNVCDGWAAHE